MDIWSRRTYYDLWIICHWHHLHYFACILYHLHNYIFVTLYGHCLHHPLILMHIVFTMWHWYPWYCFWIIYTESHTILYLHWLIKLIKPGLLGETVAGEIQGGVLGRATPYGFGCHTWSCYLCALLLLHVTWYLSTVNCFSLLSGSTNASLVWYAVVLWDGTHDDCYS